MTPELKPCPFCGGRPNIEGWVNLTKNGVIYCAACDFTLPPTAWNRRTPDLTAALARLKALEERLRFGCGEKHQTILALPEDYTGDVLFGCECSMADEIAAIITKLEGK